MSKFVCSAGFLRQGSCKFQTALKQQLANRIVGGQKLPGGSQWAELKQRP